MGSGAVPASAGPGAASAALLASAPFADRVRLVSTAGGAESAASPAPAAAGPPGAAASVGGVAGAGGAGVSAEGDWEPPPSGGLSGRVARRRRRVGAWSRRPGAATTTRDAGHALEAFEAGDERLGRGVGLGDRRPDQGELEGEARRGGPAHVGLRRDQQRDHAAELGRRVLRGLRGQALGLLVGHVEQVVLTRRGLHEQEIAEVRQHLVGHEAEILTLLHEPAHELEHTLGVPDRDRVAERVLHVRAPAPDQRRDDVLADLAGTQHRGLVEQRQRVPNRPLGLARDRVRRLGGERHAFVLRDPLEVLGDGLDGNPAEVESLAPSDDRRRHLVRLGRRQDEPNAHRRLLEHLQQRVERLPRQPLRLVDDVDLLAALDRGGGRLLAEVTRVVDAAVRRRVDLDDVQVLAVANGDALVARAAGFGGGAGLAVDHLGEDPRRRGLPGPPRSAEQERVRETTFPNRSGQGPDHVILPEDL